jgi:hypothetical protein
MRRGTRCGRVHRAILWDPAAVERYRLSSPGGHVFRPRAPSCLSLCLTMACYAPILTTRAVGCYIVGAPAWTPAKAAEYGFVFPSHVELDSAFAADRPGARRGWPWNDDLHISWVNTAPDWLRLPGDTIVAVPGRTQFHTLGNDSIRVLFSSRSDGFDAWLGPSEVGYAGLAQRVDWKTGRRESIPVELHRRRCGGLRAT